jgi:hypothetical protein
MTILRGYLPIAMTMGYLLLLLAIIISTRFYIEERKDDIAIFIILCLGISLAHRFTILLLALVAIVQAIYYVVSGSSNRISRDLLVLPAIGFAFLILQWIFIITTLNTTVYQLLNIFSETGTQIGVDSARTGSSRPVIESRLLGIVARRAHGIVLIPLAGLAWLYVAMNRPNGSQSRVGLSLALAIGVCAFIPLSIFFPDEINYTRTISVAEPVLFGLAMGAGWILWNRAEQYPISIQQVARSTLLLLLIVVIASQIGSAPIAADHPAGFRGYLETDEASAKMWGHEYTVSNVSTDPYFAHERPNPDYHVNSEGEITEQYKYKYKSILEPFTDQSVINVCPNSIMFREIYIYRSPRAQVLNWEPEPILNTHYTRLYDAGKVQFFNDPRCNTE